MILQLALCGVVYALCKDLKEHEEPKRTLVVPEPKQPKQTEEAPGGVSSFVKPPKALALSLAISTVSLVVPPLAIFAIPAVIYTLWVTIKQTYYQLVHERRITVHTLVVVTATSGLLVSIANLATVGNVLLFFVNFNLFLGILAHNLAQFIKESAKTQIVDVFGQDVGMVWLVQGGLEQPYPTEMQVPVDVLQPGDIVVVQAGEMIPIDGRVVRGLGMIDQRMLTGEVQPSEKEVGDPVFALTTVTMGKLYIEVEKTGEDTTAAHIGRVLNQTLNYKADMQLWVEEMSDKSVVPTLAASAFILPVTGFSSSWALFVSHPKYKPTVVTYINIFSYLLLATRAGILIKDGRVFERLNEVDTIVFDKTGTLTAEVPQLERIYDWADVGETFILTCAAVAEQKQTHPIARAILQEAKRRKLDLPEIESAAYKVGLGLIVTTGMRKVYVGSYRFMVEEEQFIPAGVELAQEQCHEDGHSLILVAVDGVVVGGVELRPRLRPEAKMLVSALRQRGITEMYIVSGDHETPTRKVAEQLGIDQYFAETLPENKGALIDQLQQAGKTVCYVGDGINDALALRSAAVSVSLKGASSVAIDVAQVILMDQNLVKLDLLFTLASNFRYDMRRTVGAVVVPHIFSLSGVLFWGMGGIPAVMFSQMGLALGLGSALLPSTTDSVLESLGS